MINNWQIKKIEELVDFIGGLWTGKKEPLIKTKVLRNTNFRNNGLLNFDNVAEIYVEEKQLLSRILKNGDIILEKSGGGPDQPVGRVAYFNVKNTYSYSNFTCCIRIKKQTIVDSKYLWYFLYSQYLMGITKKMQKQTTGIRNLIMSDYKNIEIPLPSFIEQKEIVLKLDKKFKELKETKQLREEVLNNTEKILSQTLHEIFEEGKKKGWEEKTINDICKVNPPKSEIKAITDSEIISFVPMSSVNEYSQSIEFQEDRKLESVKKGYTYFKKGDVLFAKITPCMENGKVAYSKNLNHKIGFGSTEFHVLRPNKNILLPEYVYQIIRTKEFRLEAEKKMTGSAGQKRVPKDFIEKYKISVPSISEQIEIVKKLDILSEKLNSLKKLQESQLEDFKKIEKAYLREAFNGEL